MADMKPVVGVLTLPENRDDAEAVLTQTCAAAGCPVTQILVPNRVGFTKAANAVLKKAHELEAPYVAILNDDLTSCSPEWLLKMIAALELDVRNVLAFPSGLCSPDRLSSTGQRGDNDGVIDIPTGSMFAAVFRTSALDTVGLLSEEYIHWASDDDYCNRVWEAGLKCVWVRHVYFGHKWTGGLAKTEEQVRWQYYDRKLFFSKWNRNGTRREL